MHRKCGSGGWIQHEGGEGEEESEGMRDISRKIITVHLIALQTQRIYTHTQHLHTTQDLSLEIIS